MRELKIPEIGYKTIDSYINLDLGGKKIVTPYYINSKKGKDLRAMVGKGTPEEIVMEARILEKIKGVSFDQMSEKEVKQFLIDRGIGIDCSGFVVQVLDSIYLETKRKHVWRALKIPDKSIYAKIRYLLRPVENLGADTITGHENTIEIKVSDVRPGDLIRSKWKKVGTHHVQLITRVEYNEDTGMPVLIEYTHSTPYYGEENGVRVGQIRVIDPNHALYEQEWLEKDEHGVNFSFEGFMKEVQDNGLRRLKVLS
ncbi:MAG: amidase domain-containing protein [Candidatus Dojkabacteria bacterium]